MDRERAKARAARTRQATASAHDHSLDSRLLEIEGILCRSEARIFALEEELDARAERIETMRQQVERADRVMAAMKTSLSWRITAPLRALKRWG
jgi:chromosome segregation ATPase